jgi:hypothetical protein
MPEFHIQGRDSIFSTTIQAVVLGTDVGAEEAAELLRLLDMAEFAHVLVYWSSLHSDQYILQYT